LPCHDIRIDPASHLFRVLQTETCTVNSSHHQSVKKLGQGVVANAWAADGVIEGIEVSEKSFCLGVQWHPEYIVTAYDCRLLEAFIEACKKYKSAKTFS
jgi:putative glutamine amidotransferase